MRTKEEKKIYRIQRRVGRDWISWFESRNKKSAIKASKDWNKLDKNNFRAVEITTVTTRRIVG